MLAARAPVCSAASLRGVAAPALPVRRTCLTRQTPSGSPSSRVAVRAIDDTNFALNLFESAAACTVAAGVTYATAENKDKELDDLQKLEIPVVGPLGAAIAVDAITHSIPGLNILFSLLAEPSGAVAGVAYMMTILLSSQSVDPKTLAPEGTVLNAEKAMDSRAAIRVPFTKIVPTALKVIDPKNEASSGAGWTIGEEGLPRLPINSVLIVLGVGAVIVEAASHAPVLGLFMPRVLQVAGWLAAAGYGFEVLGLMGPQKQQQQQQGQQEGQKKEN